MHAHFFQFGDVIVLDICDGPPFAVVLLSPSFVWVVLFSVVCGGSFWVLLLSQPPCGCCLLSPSPLWVVLLSFPFCCVVTDFVFTEKCCGSGVSRRPNFVVRRVCVVYFWECHSDNKIKIIE